VVRKEKIERIGIVIAHFVHDVVCRSRQIADIEIQGKFIAIDIGGAGG
jgi:hypothetical protein